MYLQMLIHVLINFFVAALQHLLLQLQIILNFQEFSFKIGASRFSDNTEIIINNAIYTFYQPYEQFNAQLLNHRPKVANNLKFGASVFFMMIIIIMYLNSIVITKIQRNNQIKQKLNYFILLTISHKQFLKQSHNIRAILLFCLGFGHCMVSLQILYIILNLNISQTQTVINKSMLTRLIAFLMLVCTTHCHLQKVFYERMDDGTYIVAVPHDMAKDRQSLKHELGKYFHLPEQKHVRSANNSHRHPHHQQIDFTSYPSNTAELNIQNSADKSTLLKVKNLCLGGDKDKSFGSQKQKLEAFKKGVCSPVIIVPGILATSLVIDIDCQKLRNYNQGQIFTSCGWSSCSAFSINKPADSYLLWVGLQITLKVTSGYSKCFGDVFGLLYNGTAGNENDFSAKYSTQSGITSTWFGNTETSAGYSRCGANAIRDLNGYVSLLSVMGSQCALKDYGRLIDVLEAMGYQSGVTMQPLPYDFRYGILASSTPSLFPQSLNNLHYMTGKKVVIVAHSLGTLHTLMNLAYFVTPKQKQKMVRHYIPITPPWFGTISAIRNMLYGDTSYFTSGLFPTGINKYSQMKFSKFSGSSYDLFVRDAFKIYRDEPWMQQIIKRVKYEEEGRVKNITYKANGDLENGEEDYPMKWFPSKYQKCFDDFYKRNPYCQTGFIDFVQSPIFEVKGKKYYGTQQSMTELFQDELTPEDYKMVMDIWSQTKVPNKTLRSIPAPGVNTSMVFTTVFDTEIYYKYDKYAKQDNLGDNNFFKALEIGKGAGDISVPSWSALLYVAKWIHNGTNGNKTVNVVEYCGNYKGTKQHYSTITCECNRNPFKNQLDCTHPCIISDKYMISFIMGILTNVMKGYDDEPMTSVNLNEDDIKMYMNKCLNLKKNNYIPAPPLAGLL